MKNYEKTNYSKIYKYIYWGWFDYEENKVTTQEIINNRNNFIRDFGIKGIANSQVTARKFLELFDRKFRDHTEIYKNDRNEFVIVCSPYVWNHETPEHFFQTYKLYSTNSKTFMCCISLNRMKRIIRENQRDEFEQFLF